MGAVSEGSGMPRDSAAGEICSASDAEAEGVVSWPAGGWLLVSFEIQ